MTPPPPEQLWAALEATWPAAHMRVAGPWTLRDGHGGGKRVSAATTPADPTEDDITLAERAMQEAGQTPLFMLRPGQKALDRALEDRGYDMVDPTVLYLGWADALTADIPIAEAMECWPPLSIQREIWAAGGIGPARLAVMERAADPKTTLIARTGDEPAGTAFIAILDDIAMIHAIEVTETCRRKGVAQKLIAAGARWALRHDAQWIALAVTRANAPANALYQRLGMDEVADYHYRLKPGGAP